MQDSVLDKIFVPHTFSVFEKALTKIDNSIFSARFTLSLEADKALGKSSEVTQHAKSDMLQRKNLLEQEVLLVVDQTLGLRKWDSRTK